MDNLAQIHDTDDLPWRCAPTRGVSYKSLRYDPETKAGAVMIHMCPNTTYPRNIMHGGAEMFVLDGDVVVGGVALRRGCYTYVAAGCESEPRTTGGCVLFVTFPGRIENLVH